MGGTESGTTGLKALARLALQRDNDRDKGRDNDRDSLSHPVPPAGEAWDKDALAERAAIIAEGTGCAPDLADAFALILAATPPPGTKPEAWAAALDRIGREMDRKG